MRRFYLDTCIWIDLIENRVGTKGEPFGKEATKLLAWIRQHKHRIIISDEVYRELSVYFPDVTKPLLSFALICDLILVNPAQQSEARMVAQLRNVPLSDAVHALIARDYGCTLVSRDRHFRRLTDITSYCFPWHAARRA